MVLEAAVDPTLNCISEVIKTGEPAQPQEDTKEVAPDPNGQGNLFEKDDIETVATKKIVKEPRKRAPKPPKPAKDPKEDKPSPLNIFWKKFNSVLEKGFDNTLAELYDGMGSDTNNQKQ